MNKSLGSYDTTPLEPSRSRRLRMVFLLGFLVSFGPLSIDMYLPSLPILAK
ncbi:MAG: MFS transporter, partial [Thermoactinomyces sp.]